VAFLLLLLLESLDISVNFLAKAKGKFKPRKPGSTQSETKLLERHPVIVAKLKKGVDL